VSVGQTQRYGLAKFFTVPRPVLSSLARVDGPGLQFYVFVLSGEPRYHYRIETSADLRNWAQLQTVLLTSSPQPVFDFSPAEPVRFYRALLQP